MHASIKGKSSSYGNYSEKRIKNNQDALSCSTVKVLRKNAEDSLGHFLIQFGIKEFSREGIIINDGKHFLVSSNLIEATRSAKKPFYIGTYLGKSRGEKFFPSVNLLRMIDKRTHNKVWVDSNTEWLFVCGRDIFSKGIKRIGKTVEKGSIVLVLNMNNEVLGFGKMFKSARDPGTVIENILDIGDFLRREKRR